MSTKTHDPSDPHATPAPAPMHRVAAAGMGESCVPCDIPAFCRNHYYRGKLLTEREFADEQRYVSDRHRLHQVALHGWGVACGIAVHPHPYCPDRRLVIDPGLAIDSCGREIRILREVTIDLPQPPKKNSGPSRTPPAAAPPAAKAPHHADDGHQAYGDPTQHGSEGHPQEECGCDDGPPSQTYYLCVAYAECDAELAPAPFDECGCNAGAKLQPNRICEGFRLELYDEKPSFWDEAVGDECEAEDCRHYYREGQKRCRTPGGFCCVPLAKILDVVPGEPVRPGQIVIEHNRRRMASTETLDRVVRCILAKLPAEDLTRIDDVNWEHDQRYSCREFMSEFVGTAEQPRGFRISFDAKVRADTITNRTFQATIIHRSDDPVDPRRIEIAPASIQKDEGETDWARLVIHPEYARRHLERHDFEVFVTLRCDDVIDHRELAVDGNFIAHRFPTGNNLQGGTFESWIRVHPRVVAA